MSNISKRRREGSRSKIKSMGDHRDFLKRITRTLYYGQLPSMPCLSLPVTEISCTLWSASQQGRSLRRLHADAAAGIARGAYVSPCALVLAILYLERLRTNNPDYLANAAPTELFLVSLMIGNKFLQDDGEEAETMAAEWAAAGKLPLGRLKLLERDFLNAIEWNVYVNEESFETGLSWLERQVALKQAQARGFFTYSDLTALVGASDTSGSIAAAAGVCAALAVGYVAAFSALLASAFLVSHASLPSLHNPSAPTTVLHPQPEINLTNSTTRITLPNPYYSPDKPKCCTDWLKYQNTVATAKNIESNWYDSVIIYDWKLEPWWFKTSVFNWLYQSSLVNPLQKWLERIGGYADMIKQGVLEESKSSAKRFDYIKRSEQPYCVRQWLNLSKLSALVGTVSDR